MTNLNHHEHWHHLANPGHEHTRQAMSKILAQRAQKTVLNCATPQAPARNLTDFQLPPGLTVEECLKVEGSGIIPDCLRKWSYTAKIRSVEQPPFFKQLPIPYKNFAQLPWFQCDSPAQGLGINARHIRYHHDLWHELKPKVLRGVHTTLVLAMPQIGYALSPHIQLEKNFLYLGSLARGLCNSQLFPARYLFPDANLGALADAPAPIFSDLLPATCGYAWPCVEREPDPWRVLARYDGSDRYYGYPFGNTTGDKDTKFEGSEAGAMLLPNGSRVCARHSESTAYATGDPYLHHDLKLSADGFEAATGLLRGTVTHDGLPFLLPVQMQCMVYAVIVGEWEMELDRPGDLTSYSLRTKHSAIRGFDYYQRVEPYFSNFMRLINDITGHPDFASYLLTNHQNDSWLDGNLCVANRLSDSEREVTPEFTRSLYRQQLDWQMGVTNLMNNVSFRTARNGDRLLPLSGEQIERQFGVEGLVMHQLQRQLRFDTHLFPRPTRPPSLWPNHHPGWAQLDRTLTDATLPKL